MNKDGRQWTKDEYLAHIAQQRQKEVEESEVNNEKRKMYRKIRNIFIAFIFILALLGRYVPDILESVGIPWPEELNVFKGQAYDPEPYIKALVAPSNEATQKIYKWESPLKIHTLNELSQYDQNAIETITGRLIELTPLDIRFVDKKDANVFVFSSTDVKSSFNKHFREVFSQGNRLVSTRLSDDFLVKDGKPDCGYIAFLDTDTSMYIDGALMFWNETLYDDQTRKCIAGMLSGIAGLRGMLVSGQSARTRSLDPTYLTKVDIDLLNRVYRDGVRSGATLDDSMDGLLR